MRLKLTVKHLIETLKDFPPDTPCAWWFATPEDVRSYLEENEKPPLTDEEIAEVLSMLEPCSDDDLDTVIDLVREKI